MHVAGACKHTCMYMKQSMMYRAEKLFERVWCAHEHIRYIGMVLAKNRGVARCVREGEGC